MKAIQSLLFTAVLTVGFSTTQVLVEESQGNKEQTARTETKVLDKKIAAIQAQIGALEKKGIENLSDDEFVKYDELSEQLLAAMRAKTAEQRKIIAVEKAKQAAENEKQEILTRVEGKLDSIEGSLSPSNSSK